MSRSGYSEDCENINLYRGRVARAVRGRRGQAFLREMGTALDAMEVKELITDEIVTEDGQACAIGAVALARGLDVSALDVEDSDAVADVFGIAPCLAAEIAFENDEAWGRQTPAERWERMRKWVDENTKEKG